MTLFLCSLSAVIGAALGYLMARPRKVRPVHEPSEFDTFWNSPTEPVTVWFSTSSEALASYARQSGENAARAVS